MIIQMGTQRWATRGKEILLEELKSGVSVGCFISWTLKISYKYVFRL